MKKILKPGFIALASALFITASCSKDDKNTDEPTATSGDFKLEFSHDFDGEALDFTKSYTNGSGENLEFTKVRYYISNVKLEHMDGTVWAEENSYHLVDGSDDASQTITFSNVPVGSYHSISYMIGVDSIKNVSGAQEGVLSPANDMFWSWNSGYIFFKIEGNSPQAADSKFIYHIGGFAGPNKALMTNTHSMHDNMMAIDGKSTPTLHMEVNLKNVFDGMHPLSVAAMSKVHMPGMMAMHVAHNFQGAFKLGHTHN